MHPTTSRHSSPLHSSSSRDDTFHMDYLEDEADELVLPADSLQGRSDLEERVQSTQHRLAQLRQEAEDLEQEKQRFEELSRQQKEFMQGRAEMGEKLSRALAHLDRETYEAQRRVEQLLVIKDSFNHQLDVIDSLNPDQWDSADLRHDLSRALGMIDESRGEYLKGSARVHQLTTAGPASQPGSSAPSIAAPAASPPAPASDLPLHAAPVPAGPGLPLTLNRETFRFWLFCGLGFTVPLAVTAMVIFLTWLAVR